MILFPSTYLRFWNYSYILNGKWFKLVFLLIFFYYYYYYIFIDDIL